MLDTQRYQLKLYTTPGGEKLLKRKSGTVEKQYRLNLGKLPVAYRCMPLRDSQQNCRLVSFAASLASEDADQLAAHSISRAVA